MEPNVEIAKPDLQPNVSVVEPLPAESSVNLKESTNSIVRRLSTPPESSNKFIAMLQRVVPGKTIELKKSPEMVADEVHPVAHELRDRDRFNKAVIIVESTDDYTAVRKGNGAMGAYQVMPQWLAPLTKKFLGKEVSRKEFMANPKVQDELFNAFMDEYVPKEGLRNATSRWFIGKNYDYAMGNNESKKIIKDGNGLTAEDYWQKVSKHYGR